MAIPSDTAGVGSVRRLLGDLIQHLADRLGQAVRWWDRVAPAILRYLFFLRFQLFFFVALVAIPTVVVWVAPRMFSNLMVFDNAIQPLYVTCLALTGCWLCMTAVMVVLTLGPERFEEVDKHQPFIQRVTRARLVLCRHRFVFFSLPALPLAVRLCLSAESNHQWVILGVVLGAGAAVVILWAATVLYGAIVPAEDRTRMCGVLLPERWLPQMLTKRSRSSMPRWAAMLGALGPGYLNEETGRPFPEHVAAFCFLLVLGCFWLWSFFSGRYYLLHGEARELWPALVYLEYSLLLATLLLSAVAFFFDRYRAPVLLMLVMFSWFSYSWAGNDHYFRIFSPVETGDPNTVQTPVPTRQVVQGWFERQPQGRKPVMVVVCASGGGIQATAWTARVLVGLQRELGPDFSRAIALISATSGGSVGAFDFVESYFRNHDAPDEEELSEALRAAETSEHGATAWALAYPDGIRLLFPWIKERTLDRGWALEQVWRWAFPWKDGGRRPMDTRLSQWTRAVAEGWLPATVFNATFVDSGQALLFSTTMLPLKNVPEALLFGEGAYPGADISVVTAVRMSAAFPYISPAARARYVSEETGDVAQEDGSTGVLQEHVADGGYFDNYGVWVAVEWLRRVLKDNHQRLRHVIIIQLRAEREAATKADYLVPAESEHHSGWAHELLSPIEALINTRTPIELARNDLAERLLHDEYPGLVSTVVFAPGHQGPLSWDLTPRQREQLERDWKANGPEVEQVRQLYLAP